MANDVTSGWKSADPVLVFFVSADGNKANDADMALIKDYYCSADISA